MNADSIFLWTLGMACSMALLWRLPAMYCLLGSNPSRSGARERRAFAAAHAERTGSARGNDASRDFEWYYSEGLTYSERTTSDISVRVLPTGCITGTSGPGIFSRTPKKLLPALGYFNTAVFRQLLELSIGSGDAVASGSAARHYTVGNLGRSPMPPLSDEDRN